MAITVLASGTQAASVSTEHTLATDTNGGVRVLAVDLAGHGLTLRGEELLS